ncbi:DNA repair protein endonuclease SAE2/CtIP C-terminus-domain-containing protein [Crepidotus variabilis]|uniref:DNA repair protein endonuclease SAE2/CtIP C-terminus-domain-containing protein n=1 Tax=Crepidotus variabilis TaxID=179855 RepID=A0A9P6JL68_9AGAR|nr:DNA repair protein endonuclease SAE2/CtIP C-terminus-domain-containing protein [Crepidotus variabilis]
MTTNLPTFSSAQLRDRDQKLCEQFEVEKTELNRKLKRFQQAADHNSNDLFDALNRNRRLAESLGFKDEFTAHVFINSADHVMSFYECFKKVKLLEMELKCEKQEVAILTAKLRGAEATGDNQDELNKLKRELEESNSRHTAEMTELQKRYDQLQDVKNRAAERYKSDYKKWDTFNKWLFTEDTEHKQHRSEPGISKEEKRRRDKESFKRKRQKMVEMGPDMARIESELGGTSNIAVSKPPPIGGTFLDHDKENSRIPQSQSPSKPGTSLFTTAEHLSSPGLMLKSVTNIGASSPSQTLFLGTDATANLQSLVFQPVFESITPKQEPGLPQSPSFGRSLNFKRSYARMPSSSDTEDDSQAVCVPGLDARSGKPSIFKVPAQPASTSRVYDTRDRLSSSLSARPSSSSEPRKKLELLQAEPMRSEERPSKIRRLSSDVFSLQPQPSSFVHKNDENSTPLASWKGKGKALQKENDITPIAAKNSSQKRSHDYSSFKGRGRYAANVQNADKTINGQFVINPVLNSGKNYQYDEVVRNREERKKMHGGDCECCRDYYENVGPLPPRLQQPLWRSPTRSPSKFKRRRSVSPSPREITDMGSRRQAISRHRHTWARAKTPPGYWDIGFPDTQQVGDINQKAHEMQQQKLDEVEKEAERDGGRFRKRH